jgi:short-subunit dehydrogenase
VSDFSQKTVIITGASEGVGRCCAEQFHDLGANVVLVARRQGPLQALASTLDPERALVKSADVADSAALAELVEATLDRFGCIDGLVNNAGAHFRGPVLNRSAEELASMVDVNIRGPIVLTRLCLPYLSERSGFVVNLASLAGHFPIDGAATYSSSKVALRYFTFALGEELRATGVSVSAVSPGPIQTGFIMEHLDEVADITFSQTMTTPEHVAEMVLQCARDGQAERVYPPTGARLAILSTLFPALRRWVKPLLERKGRKVKEALRRG